MGGSVGTAVRVINGVQAVGGTLNASDNLAAGNYGAAALDLVGVAFNSFQMVRPCFPGDVQVLTRRGWVRWDALTTTDEVLSLPEHEPDGELAYRPVEEVFRRWGRIWEVTVAGRVLRTTAEHPFWVRGRGWTAARELRVGDALRSHDGQWLAVEAVRDTGREEMVYNCRVAEYHTYFVGDAAWGFSVWAHNQYTPNKYVRDYATQSTKNWSATFKSEGEARVLARTKLGKNPVEAEPGKWRSRDGKWQYRAKPGDVSDRHIHLEELNPETGEVIQNLHLRWPEGAGR